MDLACCFPIFIHFCGGRVWRCWWIFVPLPLPCDTLIHSRGGEGCRGGGSEGGGQPQWHGRALFGLQEWSRSISQAVRPYGGTSVAGSPLAECSYTAQTLSVRKKQGRRRVTGSDHLVSSGQAYMNRNTRYVQEHRGAQTGRAIWRLILFQSIPPFHVPTMCLNRCVRSCCCCCSCCWEPLVCSACQHLTKHFFSLQQYSPVQACEMRVLTN